MSVFYSATQSATYQRRRKKHNASKRCVTHKSEFKSMEPVSTFIPRIGADHSKFKSHGVNATSSIFGTKKESPKYTGTYVKGISTLHKSNAVPIVSKEQAIEHSQMRRN